MALAFPIVPMKAALGTLPVDDERWAYEIKWDGYRTLAFVDGADVRLQSSHLLDVTAKYPELSELPAAVHAGSATHEFSVWIAADAPSRERGLMFVRELPPDRGMLFLFEFPQPLAFWMKNTYVSLDLAPGTYVLYSTAPDAAGGIQSSNGLNVVFTIAG